MEIKRVYRFFFSRFFLKDVPPDPLSSKLAIIESLYSRFQVFNISTEWVPTRLESSSKKLGIVITCIFWHMFYKFLYFLQSKDCMCFPNLESFQKISEFWQQKCANNTLLMQILTKWHCYSSTLHSFSMRFKLEA